MYVDLESLAFKERELDKELQLKKLEFQREREREEWTQRKSEWEFKECDKQLEVRKMELELAAKSAPVLFSPIETVPPITPVFDVSRHARMVPHFSEQDVEKYFPHFKRVAMCLQWPKDVWTSLLQCVLVGREQDVYSSLSTEQSLCYETMKTAILHAYSYELPEVYCQRFRGYRKVDKHTYVEFAYEKECEKNTFELLRQVIFLEEFKTCSRSSDHVSK